MKDRGIGARASSQRTQRKAEGILVFLLAVAALGASPGCLSMLPWVERENFLGEAY